MVARLDRSKQALRRNKASWTVPIEDTISQLHSVEGKGRGSTWPTTREMQRLTLHSFPKVLRKELGIIAAIQGMHLHHLVERACVHYVKHIREERRTRRHERFEGLFDGE